MEKRIIKFRGKTTRENKWIYGGISFFEGYVDMFDENDIVNSCETVHPETVGQFTGLLDKKGKEIYELDIVGYEDDSSKAIIVWDKKLARFGLKYINSRMNDVICEISKFHIENCILIGNIYENQELL